MKKFKINSIKGLVLLYLLFLVCILCSFLAIKYVALRRTEGMLIENTRNQLNLLDNKLQTDLTGVQLKTWELLTKESLTYYEKNYEQSKDITSEIRVEADVKKILTDSVMASSTIGTLDVFWLTSGKHISSGNINSDIDNFPFIEDNSYKVGWSLIKDKGLFYTAMAPFISGNKQRQNFDFLVTSKVKRDYLSDMLNSFSGNDYLTIMLLSKNGSSYYTGNEDKEVLQAVQSRDLQGNIYNYEFRSKNGKYQVLMKRNALSGMWVVSYFNMNEALKQYRQVNDLTSVLLIFLLIMSILISIFFYKNFYANFELMIHNFKAVEDGNYNVRIKKSNDRPKEFEYMFKQFNSMLDNTEDLIEELKIEMSLRENAEFRQLQAQINPHFLYNNLLFIMSMAKSSPEAVISMTEHLSGYYRYLTKQYSLDENLGQECLLAEHYLTIMSLRKNINFKIVLPENLVKQPFMTLILQPLVENAIQHGVEQKRGANIVQIRVEEMEKGFFIRVIDDGPGLTKIDKENLEYALNQVEPKNQGSIGLWNVNHRLINRYGNKSRLQFSDNEFGGLTVYFFVSNGGVKNESCIS